MKRILQKAALLLLTLVLIAPAVSVGAFALSDADPLLYADLDRADFAFNYTPPANSDYTLYLFSRDGKLSLAYGEIWRGDELIASGAGKGAVCGAWLVEGMKYTLRVKGSGRAIVEVARNTLSRCFDTPLEIEEGVPAGKMIARAHDAHWYRFTAARDGGMMLTALPEADRLELGAMLFDAGGSLISEFETMPGGACMLLANTRAGQDYYLRLCAPEGGTGYYSLNLHRSEQDVFAPALRFSQESYTVASGSALSLSDELAGDALLWVSDAPRIATVTQDGQVHGLRSGEVTITAHGMNSRASCRVQVENIPTQGVNILAESLTLAAGDGVDVQIEFTPENASDRRLAYRIADPELAEITPEGVLRGLKPGETTLTIRTPDGFTDIAALRILAPERRYRALLVGEQSYPSAVNTDRRGGENSVAALEGLLKAQRYGGAAWNVSSRADLSKAELIVEIRAAFAGATEQDVSLFYITCHGNFSGGMSFLELSDGSSMAVRDLERELRAIPGTIIVMIDCCGSGGSIGAASDHLAFARGITGAFSGPAIRGSKYKVLASAGLDEDSFRIAFNEEAASGVMATVFARALCDGAGWNIDEGRRGALGADADFNGSITLNELYNYMFERVNWYLGIASELTGQEYRQSVQVYPEGDPFVLFESNSTRRK